MTIKTFATAAALTLTAGMAFADAHASNPVVGGTEMLAEKKIIKIASRFMVDEVKRDADINRQKAAIGFLMESDPQIQKQKNVQQLQKDICDYCNHDLVNAF